MAELNEALKASDVLETLTWRWIQRLADIRNYCCHNKDRDPTDEEVAELLDGVDKAVETVY